MIGQLTSAQELAEARAKLYQLLRSIYFKPPNSDFLKSLVKWLDSLKGTEAQTQLLSEQMKHALDELDGFFKKVVDDSWDELAEAVSVEFTRLFRGISRQYSPPPPYESLYREDPGRVFGDLTLTVCREYRQFGLALADELKNEPPDHISFELDFMRLLCHQEAESWGRNDEEGALRLLATEHKFLAEHLLAWLPRFCNEVRKQDRQGLFGILADLTEGWVSFDYQQHLQETD